MSRSTPKILEITLLASEGHVFPATGRKIKVLEASGKISLTWGDLDESGAYAERGIGYAIPDNELPFTAVKVMNTSGATNVLIVAVYSGTITDDRISGTITAKVKGSSNLVDVDDIQMIAAAHLILAADTSRTSVTITALGTNTGEIRVGSISCSASRGQPISANDSITMQTGAAVYAYGAAANWVALSWETLT